MFELTSVIGLKTPLADVVNWDTRMAVQKSPCQGIVVRAAAAPVHLLPRVIRSLAVTVASRSW